MSFEILNPKYETNPHDQKQKNKHIQFWNFGDFCFESVSGFAIRIPIFSFLFCIFLFMFQLTHANAFDLHGFSEGALGLKFGDERTEKDEYNFLEGRLQLKSSYFPEKPVVIADWNTEFFIKGDLLLDGYKEEADIEIREAYVFFNPANTIDIKLGRQILTWGTGDLVFINDLFPKDFVSFFIGRDDEYLKLPSDASRFSFFSKWASINVVLIPFFEPDNPIAGHRLSFYDSFAGEIVGDSSKRVIVERKDSFENTEIALRIYRNFGSMEGALYGFRGFYKQSRGISNPDNFELFYPKLNVYGGSLRGPILGGIGNIEIGYYDSKEDRSGSSRLIENSSIKYLFGYERDLGRDFKAGVQYYLEHMLDYNSYKSSLLSGDIERDEFRHLLTTRLAKLLKNQTMELGLFIFYSPSDSDLHLRPQLSYKITDNWKATVGANIFSGKDDFTEFGQLEGNNNVYTRVRYSF